MINRVTSKACPAPLPVSRSRLADTIKTAIHALNTGPSGSTKSTKIYVKASPSGTAKNGIGMRTIKNANRFNIHSQKAITIPKIRVT